MKVDNPEIMSDGTVCCDDCPFADENGSMPDKRLRLLCARWDHNHDEICPTLDTYAEACKLAEKEMSK